jgi:hypothetical protein
MTYFPSFAQKTKSLFVGFFTSLEEGSAVIFHCPGNKFWPLPEQNWISEICRFRFIKKILAIIRD